MHAGSHVCVSGCVCVCEVSMNMPYTRISNMSVYMHGAVASLWFAMTKKTIKCTNFVVYICCCCCNCCCCGYGREGLRGFQCLMLVPIWLNRALEITFYEIVFLEFNVIYRCSLYIACFLLLIFGLTVYYCCLFICFYSVINLHSVRLASLAGNQ